jgi:hypothetical protein
VRRWAPLLASLGAVAAVVVPYAALGGASYEPTPLADPCETREWRDPGGLSDSLEQVALSGLDGAACDLGISREELVLALRDEESLDEFTEAQGLEREDAGACPGGLHPRSTTQRPTRCRLHPRLARRTLKRATVPRALDTERAGFKTSLSGRALNRSTVGPSQATG